MRDKLFEARYFLDKMKECEADRDPFRYNLSAFLSAARSTTLVMQKEFAHTVGFKDRYATTEQAMKSDPVFHFMNKKRVMTVHHEPVRPASRVSMTLVVPAFAEVTVCDELVRANGRIEKGEPEKPPQPSVSSRQTSEEDMVEYLWAFDDGPDKDVVALCEEYWMELERIIIECEAQFVQDS